MADPRGDPVAEALKRVLDERERYFDRRGVLNSDGRRLVASAARRAARMGLRLSADRAWRLLKDPTWERVSKMLLEWWDDV